MDGGLLQLLVPGAQIATRPHADSVGSLATAYDAELGWTVALDTVSILPHTGMCDRYVPRDRTREGRDLVANAFHVSPWHEGRATRACFDIDDGEMGGHVLVAVEARHVTSRAMLKRLVGLLDDAVPSIGLRRRMGELIVRIEAIARELGKDVDDSTYGYMATRMRAWRAR